MNVNTNRWVSGTDTFGTSDERDIIIYNQKKFQILRPGVDEFNMAKIVDIKKYDDIITIRNKKKIYFAMMANDRRGDTVIKINPVVGSCVGLFFIIDSEKGFPIHISITEKRIKVYSRNTVIDTEDPDNIITIRDIGIDISKLKIKNVEKLKVVEDSIMVNEDGLIKFTLRKDLTKKLKKWSSKTSSGDNIADGCHRDYIITIAPNDLVNIERLEDVIIYRVQDK